MNWLRQARIEAGTRVRALFRRSAQRDRLDEEMRLHLELRVEQLVAGGCTPQQAARRARVEFGNVSALRESAADMWQFGSVERLLQDLRYSFRTLTRMPGFSAAAIAILAIGIGINAAVFGVVNALFLKSLPVADPARVVRIHSGNFSSTRLSDYLAYRDRNSTLAGLAASSLMSAGVRFDAESERAPGEMVSGNYFGVLGIRATQGRMLEPSDDTPDAAPVMVISYGFWQKRFNGAPVVGRTIAVNDRAFTVVGIVEPAFTGIAPFLPMAFAVPTSADRLLRPGRPSDAVLSVQMLGRLKPGVNRERVHADLALIGRQLRIADGSAPTEDDPVSVYPALALPPEALVPMGVFMAIVIGVAGLVLMIVCVNVANLVLARSASRRYEFAIRQSIGAGRGRLVRQVLTENCCLCAVAACAGLATAYALLRLLRASAVFQVPLASPIDLDIALDWHVLVFLLVVTLGSTLAVGITPALAVSRTNLLSVLKGASAGPRQARTRRRFLIAQVALSVLLLVMAGLCVNALRAAKGMDIGFDPGSVLTASLDLEARGYSADRGTRLTQDLLDRIGAAPGVVSANAVELVPLALSNRAQRFLREGEAPAAAGEPPVTPLVYLNSVAPGHFRTLSIDRVAGRDFNATDTATTPAVAIVNQTLASTYWPGQSAIGKRIREGGENGTWIEVIGVVRDSKYVTVGEAPKPFLYRSLAQSYSPRPILLVRASGSAESVLPAIRQAVRDLDPGLPVFDVMTMETATAASLLPIKLIGRLLATLGLFALSLSALGTYSVLAFLVRSRSREFAIRLAIGASPRAVGWMVVRQALGATAIGTGTGIAVAILLSGLLRSLLFGVSPYDVSTYTLVPLVIAAAAGAAAALPARRAGKQDPVIALRQI